MRAINVLSALEMLRDSALHKSAIGIGNDSVHDAKKARSLLLSLAGQPDAVSELLSRCVWTARLSAVRHSRSRRPSSSCYCRVSFPASQLLRPVFTKSPIICVGCDVNPYMLTVHYFTDGIRGHYRGLAGGAEIARLDKTAPDQTARLNNGGP